MGGLYSLGIWVYGIAISIASLFDQKAKRWKDGRRNYFEQLPSGLEGCIWMHCASLGEFEQGRSIIEEIRKITTHKILLSFFSPSGYEVRKNYDQVDAVVYLPLDTKVNSTKFLDHFSPSKAIFVKYEIWHNFYKTLSKRGIPTFLVSAIFRKEQVYFKPYGNWFLQTLKNIDHIFCQDENSRQLLAMYRLRNVTVAGDTRFDRVKALHQEAKVESKIEKWLNGRKAIIAGSTWPSDEVLLFSLLDELDKNIALIIAPHEVTKEGMARLKNKLEGVDFYTAWEEDDRSSRTMVVDTIGLLSILYRYGLMAYIGGGFGHGIHNTLEPAAYGIPVIFGPRYHKFNEAKQLIKLGGAYSIDSDLGLIKLVEELLESDTTRARAGKAADDYVKSSVGATQKIVTSIMN